MGQEWDIVSGSNLIKLFKNRHFEPTQKFRQKKRKKRERQSLGGRGEREERKGWCLDPCETLQARLDEKRMKKRNYIVPPCVPLGM